MSAVRVGERVEVTGLVQGVGFRPFVHRLATELGLQGHVRNDSTGVVIELSGPRALRDEFCRRLRSDGPPLAVVETVSRHVVPDQGLAGFSIDDSQTGQGERTLIPPDTAVCAECLVELFDPANRRFRHAFITCTNCGPRFTIITGLPYDRPNTTMAGFALCSACRAEYDDPANRRHHAQPIGCHDCGPVLRWSRGAEGTAVGAAALDAAAAALRAGEVVAIKGLGGYHLACDAAAHDAVAVLRARKYRPDKPFAVMVADIDTAAGLAEIDPAERALLAAPAGPIVLLRARANTGLASLVAPGNPLLGVMLPYTPLHHLLFDRGVTGPLVMTSANVAGEPLAFRDGDDRLHALADAVLGHDREIHLPCDDSVVRVARDRLLPVRRARGYAPIPVPLRDPVRTVLAVGGELKNTFCIATKRHAWISQHLGDAGTLATLKAFEAGVAGLGRLCGVEPEVVAADRHPDYLLARWARNNCGERPLVEIQHHHAHIASVMAEHSLDPHDPVIGFAFDGTGYGLDGTIWGGEVMVATVDRCDRVAHLAPVPLPGGDTAIANPYRCALAHLHAAGLEWADSLAPVAEAGPLELELLRTQLAKGFGAVPTSSMGRLFDAVASLVGLRHRITYEAQAAIDLESAAISARGASLPADCGYAFGIDGATIEVAPVLAAIVSDLANGVPVGRIALRFHGAVAALVATVADELRRRTGIGTVVLSGGVFQNVLLTELCLERLRSLGFEPLSNRVVPPNDGGLSLGQAYIAAHCSSVAARPKEAV